MSNQVDILMNCKHFWVLTKHHIIHEKQVKTMVKQPILVELEYFINGVANFYSLPANALPQLSQCSLNLLENLPASREAVFEYFALLFDASVGNYMKLIDVSVIGNHHLTKRKLIFADYK